MKRALVTSIGILTYRSFGSSDDFSPEDEPLSDENLLEIKDLVLWAPYQAFLPGNHDLTLHSPNEGTRMGTLKASDILKGDPLTLRYWHGHGGSYHQVTITTEHFNSLKSNPTRVLKIPTTIVDEHFHVLLIDPKKTAF